MTCGFIVNLQRVEDVLRYLTYTTTTSYGYIRASVTQGQRWTSGSCPAPYSNTHTQEDNPCRPGFIIDASMHLRCADTICRSPGWLC